MKKVIIGFVVGVSVLGGLIWTARPDSSDGNILSVKSNSTLVVEGENDYDFDTISMSAGKVKNQFKIRNTGNETVLINKIYTSCMCTTAELAIGDKRFGPYGMPGHETIPKIDGAVDPNGEAVIEVVFDPAAHGPAGIGRIQRTVTLENNTGQPIELRFAATVTP